MFYFIIRKLAYGSLVIVGVIVVIFFMFFILPGDPVTVITGGGRTSVETKNNIIREFGLDKPLYYQFFKYLNDLSPVGYHANTPEEQAQYSYFKLFSVGQNAVVAKLPYLRRSYQNQKLVSESILEDIEGTIVLAFVSMFFATLIGVIIGIIAALRQNTWVDYTLITISTFGISIPSFVLALIIAFIFGHLLKDYTGLSISGSLFTSDFGSGEHIELKNLVLPAFSLALRPLSIIVQLTRSSMLEVMTQDYIRTAKAKGLLFYNIVTKHALKNALNPVITAASGWLATLLSGAFFVETVFGYRGLGSSTINAVQTSDLPVVMGASIVIAFIFVLINISVDILYSIIDPRVRLE